MVVPLQALALFLAQSHVRGLPQPAHMAPFYALAAIAFIVCVLRKLPKGGTRLDHLKASYDAEVVVVQELDQLMRQGAATFHDLPAEQFNMTLSLSPPSVSSQRVCGEQERRPAHRRGREGAQVHRRHP